MGPAGPGRLRPPDTHLQQLTGGTARFPSCARRSAAAQEAHGSNGSFPGAPENKGTGREGRRQHVTTWGQIAAYAGFAQHGVQSFPPAALRAVNSWGVGDSLDNS